MKRKILTDALSFKPKELLYHYTTQDGLLGIVKNKEIWATHTQYLNDQREYLHALKIVREEIKAVKNITTNPQHRALLNDMAVGLDGIESINVCVCSFSKDRDSLPQWRAYSDATSGFAIGFSGKWLAELTATESFYLAPCIYEPLKQRELIRALVEEVLEENIAGTPWDDENHIPRGGNLGAYLHRYAPILKDPAFEDEKEWRVISRPRSCKSERFDFRPGRSTLIPYYKFPLTSESLPFEVREIVIGPTPHPVQAKDSVSSFLVSQNLRDVMVENSVIPYRNW
jgi:hypothetical protein